MTIADRAVPVIGPIAGSDRRWWRKPCEEVRSGCMPSPIPLQRPWPRVGAAVLPRRSSASPRRSWKPSRQAID